MGEVRLIDPISSRWVVLCDPACFKTSGQRSALSGQLSRQTCDPARLASARRSEAKVKCEMSTTGRIALVRNLVIQLDHGRRVQGFGVLAGDSRPLAVLLVPAG